MAIAGAGAAAAGSIVVLDYVQNLGNSAVCNFLRDERERQQGTDFVINVGYAQLCEPYEEEPPPPVPPNTIPAGGTPCRQYNVTYQASDTQGNESINELVVTGPVRAVEVVDTEGTSTRRRFYVQGGTGDECPLEQFLMVGTSNIAIVDVSAAIIAVEPLDGLPTHDTPITTRPPLPPGTPPPGDQYEINVQINGENIETTVNFEPVITNNFGDFLPFTVAPSANFNLDVEITGGQPPRFGIDLDLEVVIPLTPQPGSPVVPTDGEPVDIPVSTDTRETSTQEFDYERIEYAIELAKCCKEITSDEVIGEFVFEEFGTVFNVGLPDGTVSVHLAIQPGQNTRIYKASNQGSEFGHGNASITVENNVLSFERIYTNNHYLLVPYELPNKGLRLSLQKGSVCVVTAYIHTPPEPPSDGE